MSKGLVHKLKEGETTPKDQLRKKFKSNKLARKSYIIIFDLGVLLKTP